MTEILQIFGLRNVIGVACVLGADAFFDFSDGIRLMNAEFIQKFMRALVARDVALNRTKS